jgi:ATP-dependent Clp protease ATP-binding subunit ClpB
MLFDEIEKAHPRVLDILLQILDAARITVATGETLNLSDFYVVLTSNLGTAEAMHLRHVPLATMERYVFARAQRSLRPELFARITEKLVFACLSYETQMEIARAMLAAEIAFVAEKGLTLTPSATVLPFLVQRGFHPTLGARPLRNVIEKHVRDAVGTAFLRDGVGTQGELAVHTDTLVIQ